MVFSNDNIKNSIKSKIQSANEYILTLWSQTILYASGLALMSHSKYTSFPSATFFGSILDPNFKETIGVSVKLNEIY